MENIVEILMRPGDVVDAGEDGTNIPIIEGGKGTKKRTVMFSFGRMNWMPAVEEKKEGLIVLIDEKSGRTFGRPEEVYGRPDSIGGTHNT